MQARTAAAVLLCWLVAGPSFGARFSGRGPKLAETFDGAAAPPPKASTAARAADDAAGTAARGASAPPRFELRPRANSLSFDFDGNVAARSGFDPRKRGIPASWEVTVTTRKKDKPTLMYYDPAKKKADHIRLKPGDPKSQYKNAQQPHVRWQRDGKPLDKDGNVLPTEKCEAAHIPEKDFFYKPPAKKN